MSADVQGSLKDTCAKLKYFSVALDESADLKAGCTLCARSNAEFRYCKKIGHLIPVKHTSIGEGIFKALQTAMADVTLDFAKFTGVSRNDIALLVGKKICVVFFLKKW